MKTYLIRDLQAVEPQNVRRPVRPGPAAPAREGLDQPARPASGPVLFIGLDVHTDSIAVSLSPSDTTEVRE
jgi:hypothetical protein